MKGILLRVGCDQTTAGGSWNAPVNPVSWKYAYVPIPGDEVMHEHITQCPTYEMFESSVKKLGVTLPVNLSFKVKVHLDPDFESLTFGEPFIKENRKLSSRGQIINQLDVGDFIAFFAAFRPTQNGYKYPLAYCLFGIFHIYRKTYVKELSITERKQCAHGRRKKSECDLVVWANSENSGRFRQAIPIGEYRQNAYRVKQELLVEWGGVNVKNGYIQRSVRPPFFNNPQQFLDWLSRRSENSHLIRQN